MTMVRKQLVVCVGPRCCRRGDVAALLEAGQTLVDTCDHMSLGTYPCFGRCATAPNALLRPLDADADPHADPGYRDLDAGLALQYVTPAAVAELSQAGCPSDPQP